MKIILFIGFLLMASVGMGQENKESIEKVQHDRLHLKFEKEKLENEYNQIVIISLIMITFLLAVLVWLIAQRKKMIEHSKQLLEKEMLEKEAFQHELETLLAEKEQAFRALQEVKQEAKRSDYELIAAVAHSFKNKLSPLKQNYSVLLRFLNKQYQDGILTMDKMVRLPQGNEKPEDVDTYERIAKRLESQLVELPKIFNDFQVLQKEIVHIEKVDLNEYFKKISEKYAGKNYQIDVVFAQKPLLVDLDRTAFESVLDNLISNAQTHGFKEEARFYQIDFILSEVEHLQNEKEISIIYKDNGVGFPPNYTFEQYKTFGNKSVYSQGSGIGGFVIGKIIELHQGKIRLIPTSKNDPFRTQIEILLPFST